MKKFHVIVLGLLLACSPSHHPRSEENESVRRAYMLIDDNRPSEAIELLRPYFQKNPQRLILRTALASAYAARGGVRVPRFYDAVADLLNERAGSTATLETDFSRRLDASGLSKEEQDILRQTLSGVLVILDSIKRFDRLPHVTFEEHEDIAYARDLLSEVEVSSRSVVLYRAVLRSVSLKYQLRGGVAAAVFVHGREGCRIELKEFSKQFPSVVFETGALADDLALVFPEQLAPARHFASELRRAAIQIRNTLEKEVDLERIVWPCPN